MSNSIMLGKSNKKATFNKTVGEDGVVIVDTTETVNNAEQVKAAFSSVVDFKKKPVKGIIYTHNHQDHVLGTAAFLDV